MGKRAKGQQLRCGVYFHSMDIAFHLFTCQLTPTPAPNPHPGPGKRVKKMWREQGGEWCLGNYACRQHLHGPHTGVGRGLLTTCVQSPFAEGESDVEHHGVSLLHEGLLDGVVPSSLAGAPSSPELKTQSKHILKEPASTKMTCIEGFCKPEGVRQHRAAREGKCMLVHFQIGADW